MQRYLLLFKNPVIAGFFIFAVLGLPSCDWNKSKLQNQVVVQVNERKLDLKTFSDLLLRQLKSFDALTVKDPNNIKRAKEDIVRKFILQSLIADYAGAQSIAVTDEQLEAEITKARSSYPDDLSFRRVLAQEDISFSEWRENLRFTLTERLVFKKINEKLASPTMEELKKYYEENKKKYKFRERIYLRQIIVDEISKAESIREELKKKDFADVAKKLSVSPEGKQGGLVGWVEKGSVDIFDKAFDLKLGQVSQVLESSYGFHLFKVERKAPAGFSSFEEVKTQIEQALMAQKEQAEFSGWLDRQIRASRVLKDKDLIASLEVETKGHK